MSAPRNTAGRWVAIESRNDFALDIRSVEQDATIACVYPPRAWLPEVREERRAEIVANGVLLAASPLLADALEAMLADHSRQCECPLVEQARTALRAAGRLP